MTTEDTDVEYSSVALYAIASNDSLQRVPLQRFSLHLQVSAEAANTENALPMMNCRNIVYCTTVQSVDATERVGDVLLLRGD